MQFSRFSSRPHHPRGTRIDTRSGVLSLKESEGQAMDILTQMKIFRSAIMYMGDYRFGVGRIKLIS